MESSIRPFQSLPSLLPIIGHIIRYFSGWPSSPSLPATSVRNSTGASRPALRSLARIAARLCIVGLLSSSLLLLVLLGVKKDISSSSFVVETVKIALIL